MSYIAEFLHNHKRGCPANIGKSCACRLAEARAELEAAKEVKRLAQFIVLNRNNFTDKHPMVRDVAERTMDELAAALKGEQ